MFPLSDHVIPSPASAGGGPYDSVRRPRSREGRPRSVGALDSRFLTAKAIGMTKRATLVESALLGDSIPHASKIGLHGAPAGLVLGLCSFRFGAGRVASHPCEHRARMGHPQSEQCRQKTDANLGRRAYSRFMLLQIRRWQDCLPPLRTPRKDGAPPVGTAQRKKGKVRHLPVLSPPKADSSTRPRCAIAAAGGSERQIVWGLGASYSVRPGAAQVSWRTRVSAPHGPRHRRYPTHLGDTRLAPC